MWLKCQAGNGVVNPVLLEALASGGVMGQYVSHNRTYAVEGMRGAFASPHPPVPARDGQAAWRNPHGPPAAGGHQLVEGLRPSTPPRRKASA